MTPATLNLNIPRGTTYVKSLQWLSGEPSAPVNLTGLRARMQIRKKLSDTTVLDELTTENGKIEFTDAVNGKLVIKLTSSQTMFDFETAVYDLEIYHPSGDPVYRIVKGFITIDPEVTR